MLWLGGIVAAIFKCMKRCHRRGTNSGKSKACADDNLEELPTFHGCQQCLFTGLPDDTCIACISLGIACSHGMFPKVLGFCGRAKHLLTVGLGNIATSTWKDSLIVKRSEVATIPPAFFARSHDIEDYDIDNDDAGSEELDCVETPRMCTPDADLLGSANDQPHGSLPDTDP